MQYETYVIIIVSLVLSAFFSGMEIAYVSANRVRLSMYKGDGSLKGRAISKLLERPDKYIATTLVGNNVVLVVYGYYMGAYIISMIYPQYAGTDELPFSVLLVQTLISTAVILVTGEFLPKTVFRIYANEMLEFFAIPMYALYRLLSFLGITGFMLWVSKFLIHRVFGKDDRGAMNFSFGRLDLGYYIDEQVEKLDSEELSGMDKEINIFRNALEFRDVKARECMVPRTDMQALDIKSTIDELRSLFVSTGLSKIIIYRDNIDNVVGYVHSFDLFKEAGSLKDMLMPVLFVPETMPVNEILNTLTKRRMSIAVVLDEYGGTSGMITVEDIVEELLGDIEDEHDKDSLLEKNLGDGSFLFSARQEVDYLNSQYGLDLPESDDYETLGGLILSLTENIPEKGQEVDTPDFVFTVKEASNARIDTVLVKKKNRK